MKRVAYIVDMPLSERDQARYGIDLMTAQGIRVTVIDVADLIHPHIKHQRNHYGRVHDFEIATVEQASGLGAHKASLDQADLVIALFGNGGLNRETYSVFRLISRSKTPYLVEYLNIYPGSNRFKGEAGRAGERLKDILGRLVRGEISLANSLLARLPWPLLGLRRPDFVAYSGRMARQEDMLSDAGTTVIYAHSMDYELQRPLRASPLAVKAQAVFVDEYLPYDRDYEVLGIAHQIGRAHV